MSSDSEHRTFTAHTNENGRIVINNARLLEIVQRKAEGGKSKPTLANPPDIRVSGNDKLTENLRGVSLIELGLSGETHQEVVILLHAKDRSGTSVYQDPGDNGSPMPSPSISLEEGKKTDKTLLEEIKEANKETPLEERLEMCTTLRDSYNSMLTESLHRLLEELEDTDTEHVLPHGEFHEIAMAKKAKLKLAQLALSLTRLKKRGMTEADAEQDLNEAAELVYKEVKQQSHKAINAFINSTSASKSLAKKEGNSVYILEHEKLCRGVYAYATVIIPLLTRLIEKKKQRARDATSAISDTVEMDPIEIPGIKGEGAMTNRQIAELLDEDDGKETSDFTEIPFEEDDLPMPKTTI